MALNIELQEYVSRETLYTLESASIDWLTLTGKTDRGEERVGGMDIWQYFSKATKEWSGNGYKGYFCPETKIRYGIRNRKDGNVEEMIVSSGRESAGLAEFIYRSGTYLKATRCDIQSTVFLDTKDVGVALRGYEMLSHLSGEGIKPAGARQFSLVRSGRGDTLYVGSRGSKTKLFRLYDKGGEEGEGVGQRWRQEVQFNRKYAESALRKYTEVMFDADLISDITVSQFVDGCGFSLTRESKGGEATEIEKRADKETDYEQKLGWLRRCVRPVVRYLAQEGLESEVKDALGIQEKRECAVQSYKGKRRSLAN